jgi:diguanylate cyclase (GGDEF)-like protein
MLFSQAIPYAAPALTLVAGTLGGWLLRRQFDSQIPGPERTRSRRGDLVPERATPARNLIEGAAAPCVRNTFVLALDRYLPDSARRGEPFSVMLVSIDNDRGLGELRGLPMGNETLEAVGKTFVASVRSSDWVARFDATTFVFLLPGTAHAHALIVAERLRKTVSRAALDGVAPNRLALSIGTTDFAPGDSSASILQRAEEALSAANQAGGDCVRSQPGGQFDASISVNCACVGAS